MAWEAWEWAEWAWEEAWEAWACREEREEEAWVWDEEEAGSLLLLRVVLLLCALDLVVWRSLWPRGAVGMGRMMGDLDRRGIPRRGARGPSLIRLMYECCRRTLKIGN